DELDTRSSTARRMCQPVRLPTRRTEFDCAHSSFVHGRLLRAAGPRGADAWENSDLRAPSAQPFVPCQFGNRESCVSVTGFRVVSASIFRKFGRAKAIHPLPL